MTIWPAEGAVVVIVGKQDGAPRSTCTSYFARLGATGRALRPPVRRRNDNRPVDATDHRLRRACSNVAAQQSDCRRADDDHVGADRHHLSRNLGRETAPILEHARPRFHTYLPEGCNGLFDSLFIVAVEREEEAQACQGRQVWPMQTTSTAPPANGPAPRWP